MTNLILQNKFCFLEGRWFDGDSDCSLHDGNDCLFIINYRLIETEAKVFF